LSDYRTSSSGVCRRFQPDALRFVDTKASLASDSSRTKKVPLHVTAASEPADVLWENLEASYTGAINRLYY
jgi:hypothetical protein